MIAEYAIKELLLDVPAISALVGFRIFPQDEQGQAPATPYITFQRFDRPSRLTLDADEEPGGPRIQLNCVAASRQQARALATTVREVFRGGRSIAGGINLIRIDGGGDLPNDPDTRLRGVRVDLVVTMTAAEAA